MGKLNKEAVFYVEQPDLNSNQLVVYSKERKLLYKTTTKKMTEPERIALVCFFVSQGMVLKDICTGEGWRPAVQTFLSHVYSNDLHSQQFGQAKKIRLGLLQEELLALRKNPDNEKMIANLARIINLSRSVGEARPVIFEITPWLGDEESFNV